MKLFEKKVTIKIEKEDLNDAKLSSMDFLDENTKKRAFINVLGARLAMKMLFSKKLHADNVYSLYTVHNFLEDFDIADIYLDGMRIDVRLVFNRNEIFIPKKHFECNILPDLYFVLELDKNLSHAEALGFFEPKTLNTQNANKDFYFYEYDKLNNFKDIKNFLKTFQAKTQTEISEDLFQRAEALFLSLTDKEISLEDKLFLFKQLSNSLSLREKIVEFENFELLSKDIAKDETMIEESLLAIAKAEEEKANSEQETEISNSTEEETIQTEIEIESEEEYIIEETPKEETEEAEIEQESEPEQNIEPENEPEFESEPENNNENTVIEETIVVDSELEIETAPVETKKTITIPIQEEAPKIPVKKPKSKVNKKNAIKIEKEDIDDAKSYSAKILKENIKKRAFIDVLGAKIAMKMFASKKIQANNNYSMYTINNLLKNLDIADVYSGKARIDIRLIFDRNEIFIPKSHYKYDLLPDLYFVLELDEDLSCAEPLGFFEPKTLNTENENRDFYFYDYKKLKNPKDIKNFLKKLKINTPEISDEDFQTSEELFLSLADDEISHKDKLFLFKQLASSASLREQLAEFESFEALAKEAAKNESLFYDGVLDFVGAQKVNNETENDEQGIVEAEQIENYTVLTPDSSAFEEKESEDIKTEQESEEKSLETESEIEKADEKDTETEIEAEDKNDNEVLYEVDDLLAELESETNAVEIEETNEISVEEEVEEAPEFEEMEVEPETEAETDTLDEINDLLSELESEPTSEEIEKDKEESLEIEPETEKVEEEETEAESEIEPEIEIDAEDKNDNEVLYEVDDLLAELESETNPVEEEEEEETNEISVEEEVSEIEEIAIEPETNAEKESENKIEENSDLEALSTGIAIGGAIVGGAAAADAAIKGNIAKDSADAILAGAELAEEIIEEFTQSEETEEPYKAELANETNEVPDEVNDVVSESESETVLENIEETINEEDIIEEKEEIQLTDSEEEIENKPETEAEIEIKEKDNTEALYEIGDFLTELNPETNTVEIEETNEISSEEEIEETPEVEEVFEVKSEETEAEPEIEDKTYTFNEVNDLFSELESEAVSEEMEEIKAKEDTEEALQSFEKIENNEHNTEELEILDSAGEETCEVESNIETEETSQPAEETEIASSNEEEPNVLEPLPVEPVIESKVTRVPVPPAIIDINIEEEDLHDAKLSSMKLLDEATKKRAFINVLGAIIAMKMLASKRLKTNNICSMYTINNLLENLDISDIYFEKIRIDVRLVFNRKEIFIPKSHFEYDILPDLYIVLELDKDFSRAELLGFFEPKTLNTQNANKDFYFYEYDKLNEPRLLKTFLKTFPVKNIPEISEEIIKTAEGLFVPLADKEISQGDKFFLFKQLANNFSLREKMTEFENFELLSTTAAKNESLLEDNGLNVTETQEPAEEKIEITEWAIEEAETQLTAPIEDDDNIFDELNDFLSDFKEEIVQVEDVVEASDKEEIIELTDKEPEAKIEEKSDLGALSTGLAIGGAIIGGAAAAAAAETVINEGIIKAGAETIAAGAELASTIIEESAKAFSEEITLETPIPENKQEITLPQIDESEDISFDFGSKTEPEKETFDELDDIFAELESKTVSEEVKDTNEDLIEEEIQTASYSSPITDFEEETEITPAPQEEFNADDFSILSQHDSSNDLLVLEDYNEPTYLNFGNEAPTEYSTEPQSETFDEPLTESFNKPTDETFNNPITESFIDTPEPLIEPFIEPLGALPELEGFENFDDTSDNREEETTKTEPETKPEEIKPEPKEDVFSLDDFDFTMLNETQESDENTSSAVSSEHAVSFDSITKIEGETIQEKEEEKKEVKEEPIAPAKNLLEEIKTAPGGVYHTIDSDDSEMSKEIHNFLSGFEIKKDDLTDDTMDSEEGDDTFTVSPIDIPFYANISSGDLNEIPIAAITEIPIKTNTETPIEKETPIDEAVLETPAESEIPENSTNSEEDDTDKFINDIDNFLKNLELSDEQKELIGQSLSLEEFEDTSDDSAIADNVYAQTETPVTTDVTANETDNDNNDGENKDEDDLLKVLFKEEQIDELAEMPIEAKRPTPSIYQNKKMIIAASVASVVIVSFVLGGAILNKKDNNTSPLKTTANAPITAEGQSPNELPQDNTDLNQQVPDQQAIPGDNQQADSQRDMGQAVSDAFTSSEPVSTNISKIAWEVPEDLAYNDSFRKYLQIAGKNLKLNLQNNLLLANEMAYSNKVIVDLNIARDGSLQSDNIVISSGSKQIDKIVLQSVKETIKYLKMPSSELGGSSVAATLIINF